MSKRHIENILISGASSGIGKALAISYAKSGVNLFLCARNQQRLDEVKNICAGLGAVVLIKAFDVTDEKLASDFIEEIEEKYPLDLVIANAGISGRKNGARENLAEIKQVMATNFDGVLNLIYPAVQKMKKRKKGQIAIISSLASFCGIPSSPAYSASKSAIRVYGEILRANLKRFNIGVSVVCPGYVQTEMTKENKFWMPFLMSPQKAASIIQKALAKNHSRIVFPLPLYFGIWITALLPKIFTDFFFVKIARHE